MFAIWRCAVRQGKHELNRKVNGAKKYSFDRVANSTDDTVQHAKMLCVIAFSKMKTANAQQYI